MRQYLTSGERILEIEDFIKKKTYVRVDSDPDTIIDHLAQISSIDKQCERGQKTAGFAAVGSFFLSIIIACGFPGLGPVTVLIGIVAAFAFGAAFAEHARLNVDDERYLLTEKLIEMIKRDLSRKSSISVTADFREVNHTSNFARNVLRGQLFASKWLSLEGQFVDDTRFQLTVTEFLKVKYRKNKQRHKGYRIDLTLVLRDARYARVGDILANFKPIKIPISKNITTDRSRFAGKYLSQPLPPTRNIGEPNSINKLFNLPIGASPVRLDFRGRRLMISVKMEPKQFNATPERTVNALYTVCASMFLTAYHLLNLARRISSGTPKVSA